MKHMSIGITLVAALAGLQACNSKETMAECPAATSADWNNMSADITSPLIEGYGAVHETYIKLERRGQGGLDSHVCEMSRIYCPKPYSNLGCQVFACDYTEPAKAVLKSKDYQGTKYYNVPSAGRVQWDGYTLRCQNP